MTDRPARTKHLGLPLAAVLAALGACNGESRPADGTPDADAAPGDESGAGDGDAGADGDGPLDELGAGDADGDGPLDEAGAGDADGTGDDSGAEDGGDAIGPPEPGRCPGQPDTPSPGTIARLEPVRQFGGWGGYRGSPLVATLGGSPLVVDSAFEAVTAFRADGTEVWSQAVAGRNYGGCVRADLDGDGADWIAAGDNDGAVHVWSADGVPRSGWPFRVSGDADVRSLAAADVDGDARDELVVFSSLTDSPPGGPNVNMYLLDGDASILAGWPHYREGDPYTGHACNWCGGFNLNVAVGNIDGDALPEVVFTQDRYSISVFHADGTPVMASEAFSWCGEAGRLHWGEVRTYVPHTAEFSAVCDPFDGILEFTYSPPLVADVDGDGVPEILAVANVEQPVGTTTGSALAVYAPDRTHKAGFAPYLLSGPAVLGEGAAHESWPSVVAADFRGDRAGLEILAVHHDGTLRLYAADGEELWSVTYTTEPCLCTEPVIADLDGDRVPEAAVAVNCADDRPTRFLAVDGAGAVRLDQELPFATIAAPTLADIDGDGTLDVLFQAVSGAAGVRLYRWPGTGADCLVWPTGRGDSGHRGRLGP